MLRYREAARHVWNSFLRSNLVSMVPVTDCGGEIHPSGRTIGQPSRLSLSCRHVCMGTGSGCRNTGCKGREFNSDQRSRSRTYHGNLESAEGNVPAWMGNRFVPRSLGFAGRKSHLSAAFTSMLPDEQGSRVDIQCCWTEEHGCFPKNEG